MPNIETMLRDHTTLQLECIDRLYLNGYQPTLQHEAGLLRFLLVHRKQFVASPVLLGLIQRLPHSHRYVVTPVGRRVALFFSKSYARVLRRGLARLDIPPPADAGDPLVKAWHRLNRELDRFVEEAKLVA